MAHVTVTAPDGTKVLDKTVSTSEAHRIAKLVGGDPAKNLENFSAVYRWPAVIGSGPVDQGLAQFFPKIEQAEKAMQVEKSLAELSEGSRRRVLHRLHLRETQRRHDELQRELSNLEDEGGILRELQEWLKGDLRLERPHQSAYHRLEDALCNGTLKVLKQDGMKTGRAPDFKPGAQSFVIEHDWASAFRTATDFDGGEIHLPYENCVFEFRVSGKRVCALLDASSELDRIVGIVETKSGDWVLPMYQYERVGDKMVPNRVSTEPADSLRTLLFAQIRAVCISLEAEAATTEIIRAPHKLNRKRESLGRAPLVDYHVVRLANRARVTPLEDGGETEKRTSPRLHFRRGHWRHFENHKTWVKWMLVGNPDLGFIDKHYRL